MLSDDPPRVSSQARTLVSAAGVALLLMIAMIAAAVQGRPEIGPPRVGGASMAPLVPSSAADAQPRAAAPVDPTDGWLVGILTIIAVVALTALAVVLAVIALRLLLRRWREREPARRHGADVAAGGTVAESSGTSAPPLRRGAEAALTAVDHARAAGDGVVAAWVAFETAVAGAGLVRGTAETPAEFAARLGGERAAVRADVAVLLAGYERVRFGHHAADESTRAAARAALERIREAVR